MNARKTLPKRLLIAGLFVLFAIAVALATVSVPLLNSGDNLASVNSADVVSLTNEERTDEGVAKLERNALLDHAAQMKAQDMAAKGYYAHVSPDGTTPMHWVDVAGYEYLIVGENLVVNRTDAGKVVDAFMGSPGHRANILRKDFTEIGVGVANGVYKGKDATFTVQIFAAPYPRASNIASAPSKSSKENVKQGSGTTKAAGASLSAKAKAASVVPRTAGTTTAPTVRETASTTAANADSIQEKVKALIRPLTISTATTTVSRPSTTSGSSFDAPSFVLNPSVPIELAGVSRLEAGLLPVPIGSTWSMELRSFVEGVVLGARSFFVR